MKKKNLFRLFFRSFIRSFMLVLFMAMVGVGSYKLTMFYYKEKDKVSQAGDRNTRDIVTAGKAEEVSKNLIYCVDKDSNQIKKLVVKIFNTNTHNLDFLTIPANSKFTISNDMYKKICAVNGEVPQIINLSEIGKYFDKDKVYEYGMTLIEDLLNSKISYYTVMDSSVYDSIFMDEKKSNTYFAENDDNEALGGETSEAKPDDVVEEMINLQVLRSEFISKFSDNDKESLKNMVTSIYDKMQSNLSVKDSLKYLDDYQKVDRDKIYYYGIYGIENDSSFTVAKQQSVQLVRKILTNATYTVSQDEAELNGAPVNSQNLNIEILNASNINGLARNFQEKLTEKGYKITKVGNYTETNLSDTKILVKKEGTGQDLLGFFKDAELETSELEDGVDIRIVLGTEDR